jgi:hypothetical protein
MPNPEKKIRKESITEKQVEHARKFVARQMNSPPIESGRIVQCRK